MASIAAEEDPAPIYHEHSDGLTKEQVDAMLEESHVIKKERKGRPRINAKLSPATQ
ncbi:MAG: hypothetical protein OSA48_00090 [Akkermansiaceae bacterium]|nr:hypothetical protein [Akkermansiaceae bacterium]